MDVAHPPPFPIELMFWLSPAFPVGSFAYSQGLEQAVAAGLVTDAATLHCWLTDITRHGALRNDLILVSLALRETDPERRSALADLASALQPSRERYQETLLQGEAFAATIAAAWTNATTATDAAVDAGASTRRPIALPIAVGFAARAHGLALRATLEAYATQALGALVSAAIRLGIVGQFDGQRALATRVADIRAVCHEAETASEDDLGSCTFSADLCSLEHETLTTRLFRS